MFSGIIDGCIVAGLADNGLIPDNNNYNNYNNNDCNALSFKPDVLAVFPDA
eukprot:Pgem_evm1s17032